VEYEKKVDEDWKKKAKGDSPIPPKEESPAPEQSAGAPMLEGEPSLLALVSSLAGQALVSLGRHPDAPPDSAPVDFAQAQYCIDLLGMLESKTQGNLTSEEARLLAGTLHDLRMLFVESTMAAAEKRPMSHQG